MQVFDLYFSRRPSLSALQHERVFFFVWKYLARLSNARWREVRKECSLTISAKLPANFSPDLSQIFLQAEKRPSCGANNEGLLVSW